MSGRDARFPWDFFALAYLLSWIPWGVAYLVARRSPPVTGTTEELLAAAPPAMLALVLLGVFGPFAAAFALTWLLGKLVPPERLGGWRRGGVNAGLFVAFYAALHVFIYCQRHDPDLVKTVAFFKLEFSLEGFGGNSDRDVY